MNEGAPAHKALRRATPLLLCLLAFAAQAQTPATPDGAPSEAARRAALSPYRFILQNATAPARKPAPAPEKKAVAEPAAAPAAAAPAPAAVQAAARPAAAPAVLAPAAAAAAAAPQSQPVAAPPAPEPVTTAAHTRPAEPPVHVRREIIPVRTDEPKLAAALLREKPNGVVRIQFDINFDGSTGAVKVVSSTNRALNRATVDAVNAWKFEPVDEVLTVETEVAYKFD
ncbi:energy transducer TonB [Ramlibacter albus]|uniref:Energy transducer TonB n=1 Tax=Ramlibacter albus TaxID=2079448 RepID=A0A923S5Q7_9BURK|nr:energy transducer TonB [Ramlibacter albus]MBC5768263.1 energy transducer TonB [Ramlibacter albus]